MFMLKRTHEAEVADLKTAVTYWRQRAEDDWSAGKVDSDGNELTAIRIDHLQSLVNDREKFMWQVRDTCTRAEKAEAELAELRAAKAKRIANLTAANAKRAKKVSV